MPPQPTQSRQSSTGARKPQRKVTDYGLQLAEKQSMKRTYGMREKQFRRYFAQAAKNRQQTGQALLVELERRLDNVIFRAGLALSRAQARQMVSHRHIMVNGSRVRTPSQLVVPGDSIKPYSGSSLEFHNEMPKLHWLTVNPKTREIKINHLPEASELPIEFDYQKVIEFYSK